MNTPSEAWSLSDIIHSWKSYTSHEINKQWKREGELWQEDYYDRFIRDERHYQNANAYIENNPVKAGLCAESFEWVFSSARLRLTGKGGRDARAPTGMPNSSDMQRKFTENAGETPALRQEKHT